MQWRTFQEAILSKPLKKRINPILKLYYWVKTIVALVSQWIVTIVTIFAIVQRTYLNCDGHVQNTYITQYAILIVFYNKACYKINR